MFSIMDAFIWTTIAPNAIFCNTMHIVSVPVGVLADDIEWAIFRRHNIIPNVTLAINGKNVCGFIQVRGFGDALRLRENGGIFVNKKWVSIDKCKNVRRIRWRSEET